MAPDALESRVDRLEAALVRLAEAQARTEERLAQLTARMDDLVAGLMQLAARVDDLAAAQVRTENQIALLARETGHLKGWTLEVQYRDKAFAYFQPILRRISAVSHEDLETLADRAEDKGVLSPHDHADLLHADVVIRGQLRDQLSEAYLVAEVSSMIDSEDVVRAERCAKLLARVVPVPVIAAVAGEGVIKSADEDAMRLGVWRVLNGRVFPPDTPVVKS